MLSTGIVRLDLEMSDILQGQLHKIFVPRINVVPLLTIAYCILPPCLVKNVMHVNVTGSLCTHDPFFFFFFASCRIGQKVPHALKKQHFWVGMHCRIS